MRILYLADVRFPLERANGIQSMETCHALAARGHAVTLAVRPDTAVPPRDPFAFYGLPTIASLRIEAAPVTGPQVARRAGYLTFAIGRALGRSRQDVVVTRDLGVAALLLRVPAGLRAPVVFESHGLAADAASARPEMLTGAAPASPAKLRRLAARDAYVWRAADGYVTITAGLKQELERRFGGRTHAAVIADGVREVKGAGRDAGDARSDRPFTIGYAGHLYPWKGVELVLEAVAALPDTQGLIVGGHDQEPDLARLKQYAEKIFCSLRVTFTGMLPPPDVAARLQDADVLVLPNPPSAISRQFTSPLKLFEYMASGRPIVASDLPAIREVLTDGRNALLVEAGNPHAVTEGVRRVKDDRELGRRLAAQALADVREYTWSRRAERLEALFDEVLAARGGRKEQP